MPEEINKKIYDSHQSGTLPDWVYVCVHDDDINPKTFTLNKCKVMIGNKGVIAGFDIDTEIFFKKKWGMALELQNHDQVMHNAPQGGLSKNILKKPPVTIGDNQVRVSTTLYLKYKNIRYGVSLDYIWDKKHQGMLWYHINNIFPVNAIRKKFY